MNVHYGLSFTDEVTKTEKLSGMTQMTQQVVEPPSKPGPTLALKPL